MKKVLASLFLFCVMALGAAAQRQAEFIFFYPPDQTRLDPDYLDNASQMNRLLEYISSHGRQIDSVSVYGYASPWEIAELTPWLSTRRGYTAYHYILNNTFVPREKMQVYSRIGGDGLPWGSWKRDWLSTLRFSRIFVYTSASARELDPLLVLGWLNSAPPVPFVPKKPEPKKIKTLLALKTNLLYDAFSAVNLGVSVPLGKHFSAESDLYFPWWHVGNRFALEYLSFSLEGRYWIKPRGKALTGHFIGLYGQVGKGDIQLGQKFCYQSPFFWSAGLRYGYAFPLSDKWNLELSVAGGYLRANYQHYTPDTDWSVLWRDPENAGILSFWGPTNVSVTLVRSFTVKRRARK